MYINYGHKSNEELLLGYGFVLPDNKANFVMLTIGTASRDGGTHALLQRSSVQPVGGGEAQHSPCNKHACRGCATWYGAGGSSRAGMYLRQSIAERLQVPQEHFLRLTDPVPPSLLAAAAVALLSDSRAQQIYGHMQRSLTSTDGRSPTATAPALSAGTAGVQNPGFLVEGSKPPSLSVELRSQIIGSPREQLHALRAVLISLKAKLKELGGAQA